MPGLSCPLCPAGTPTEYDPAAGNVVCLGCGCVLSENDIVADVTFGETSTGAATVEGAFMGANEVRARLTGPRGRQQTTESREQTLSNGRKKLSGLCRALNLGDAVLEQAMRFFNLAVQYGLAQGRRSIYVVASCLFLACRMSKHPTMLIDISDLLQVNVFILGSTYYRLLKDLHINEPIPMVDPSIYISRFASMLEFGEDTNKVASDAARLVKRFETDWMSCGRRPAGIAGACLLLAARMNNFRRSTLEMVQVVKIADVTLRKRLDEFSQTPSGKLTVDEFRRVWLDEVEDPPSFTDGIKRAKQRADAEIAALREQSLSRAGSLAPAGGEDRGLDFDLVPRDLRADETRAQDAVYVGEPEPSPDGSRKRKNPAAENDGGADEGGQGDREDETDALMSEAMAAEFTSHLESFNGRLLTTELDARDRERYERANRDENRLDNLDEVELDCYILDTDEVEVKKRVWMEFNREYLVKLADKKEREASGELKAPRPRKAKAKSTPRDSSNPAGATMAESIKKMISKPKFSKKVNYDQIAKLFPDDSRSQKRRRRNHDGGRGAEGHEADDGGGGEDGGDSDDGYAGWGALNRPASSRASSRAPSRYTTPVPSDAGTPRAPAEKYGRPLFNPADADDDEDGDGEEEEEEDEGDRPAAEGDDWGSFRRANQAADEDEVEGEV